MNNLIMEKQALEFRKKFNMDTDSLVEYHWLLEKTGVITVFKPLKEDFAGMAFKYGESSLFMMINSNHPKGKQNFTICHELYHLMIQENFTFMKCHTEIFDRKNDKDEYLADLFASHLLIPTDGLLERIPKEELKKDKISIETVVKTEQFFQCSRAALLFRLSELSLISDAIRQSFSKGIINSAKKYGYTDDLYTPTGQNLFIGKDYNEGLEDLYDHEKISQAVYLEMKHDIGEDLY